jgi:large subunit ribosomal protein L6
MSRLGAKPVEIIEGAKVSVEGYTVTVEGPKGTLSIEARPEVGISVEGNMVVTSIKIPSKNSSAYWGLTRSLIANMIEGVTKGYEKKLELVGVGYRATQKGANGVSITIGYSHPVEFQAPEGVGLQVVDNQNITITGIDKHQVGLAAAKIREIRKPEPYKGKGIRYQGEVVRRKPGKAGKVGA